jgi:hypothetical protein
MTEHAGQPIGPAFLKVIPRLTFFHNHVAVILTSGLFSLEFLLIVIEFIGYLVHKFDNSITQ